jgi:hypothetical protein
MKKENLFSIGNTKLSKSSLIFNLSSAHTCSADKAGLCPYGLSGNSKCYALKAEKMYKQVLPYRTRQTTYWKTCATSEFIEQVLSYRKIKYLRVNESGDFSSIEDIDKLNEIAKILKNYGIITYTYTHRIDLFKSFYTKDLHFILNISDCKLNDFNTFKVIDKIAAGKITCPGKGCLSDCKLCTVNHNKTVYVKKH